MYAQVDCIVCGPMCFLCYLKPVWVCVYDCVCVYRCIWETVRVCPHSLLLWISYVSLEWFGCSNKELPHTLHGFLQVFLWKHGCECAYHNILVLYYEFDFCFSNPRFIWLSIHTSTHRGKQFSLKLKKYTHRHLLKLTNYTFVSCLFNLDSKRNVKMTICGSRGS